MKSRFIFGGIFVCLGIIWIVGITHYLIVEVLPVQLQSPQAWAEQVYFPASSISTLIYLGFLFSWIYYSFNSRFTSSSNAKSSISLWFILFIISIISNIIVLVICVEGIKVIAPAQQSLLQGGSFISYPPYEWLIPFTILNGILLFWLPSCYLTQRTLRFIPPLSYELISLTEKR